MAFGEPIIGLGFCDAFLFSTHLTKIGRYVIIRREWRTDTPDTMRKWGRNRTAASYADPVRTHGVLWGRVPQILLPTAKRFRKKAKFAPGATGCFGGACAKPCCRQLSASDKRNTNSKRSLMFLPLWANLQTSHKVHPSPSPLRSPTMEAFGNAQCAGPELRPSLNNISKTAQRAHSDQVKIRANQFVRRLPTASKIDPGSPLNAGCSSQIAKACSHHTTATLAPQPSHHQGLAQTTAVICGNNPMLPNELRPRRPRSAGRQIAEP